MKTRVDRMRPEDWPSVREIYVEGILTGNATFETHAPTWEDWDAGHISSCRLVGRTDGVVSGWAALSPVSGRCVYAGVAEVSVYVAESSRGAGVGRALLHALVAESERENIWTLEASMFPENTASIALHTSAGFSQVGLRKRLGRMGDVWRDVLLMERRSTVAGT